jgi:diguanylate cyclase (GGDEF)-like protein
MPKEKAKIMAERIKDRIRNLVIPNLDIKAKITISIGIAVYPQDATLIEELIFLADQALYFAKIKGRDRVELINQEK